MTTDRDNAQATPRVADLVQSGSGQLDAIERAPGIWESRGIGNSYLVATNAGNVLVNTGTLKDARIGVARFAKVSSDPLRYILLTQSHANQYGGLEIYKTAKTIAVAHRLYPVERAYNAALLPHYMIGSRRFFGTITGPSQDLVPTVEIPMDVLASDEGYAFRLGDRDFEMVWTPGGETRSAMIVWLPRERIAIVGNLFGPLFGNHPNLNTLRGDKPRSALEFVESVRKLRALQPEMILTGHEVIEGADKIGSELARVADAVQWVHDTTVAGMNEGIDLSTLMRQTRMPEELELTEEYGKLSWNIRAIWHEYSGWFDPARGTTELYGVPLSSVAADIVDLAGGAERLAERGAALTAAGKPIEAIHLLDLALAAVPASATAKAAKLDALERLNEMTGGKNLWERMWVTTEQRRLAASAVS